MLSENALQRLSSQSKNIAQTITRHESKWAFLLSLLLLLAAAYTLHDVQTAQGVGLYLSIQLGISHSAALDMLCTAVCMAAMLLLTLLPAVFSPARSCGSYLRFLALFMSFIPAISTAYLAHLADGHSLLGLHPAIQSRDFLTLFKEGAAMILPILQLALPMLLLLLACYHKTPLPRGRRAFVPGFFFILILTLLLMTAALLFPELTALSEYIFWYLLLVLCHALWERLLAHTPALQTGSYLITATLCLRSIWRLMELMSHYQL